MYVVHTYIGIPCYTYIPADTILHTYIPTENVAYTYIHINICVLYTINLYLYIYILYVSSFMYVYMLFLLRREVPHTRV